ncbi:hypothetical protein [Rubrolithibacter danxiaensis]|uniref:hypothetical protein n=1 Tax=Rubrolithibacter danxiaensis TaxID=3390805 RepID=UPI003BF7F9D4
MSKKDSSRRDWFISILVTVIILSIGGYLYYKNNYAQKYPAIAANGENPQLVTYIKKKLANPASFKHIQTINVASEERPALVMKFSCEEKGKKFTYSTSAKFDPETGELYEVKIFQSN